jgi:hypothetical protein
MLSVHPGAITIRRPATHLDELSARLLRARTRLPHYGHVGVAARGREPPDDELAQCCHYQPIKAVRTLSRQWTVETCLPQVGVIWTA